MSTYSLGNSIAGTVSETQHKAVVSRRPFMYMRTLLILSLFAICPLSHAEPVSFEDQAGAVGLTGHTESWGLSWGDINGDRWPDLFLQGHRDFPRFYRNNGAGGFDDVAYEYDPAQVWLNKTYEDKHGATIADVDNDGDKDLLIAVSASGPAEMLVNLAESGGKFVDMAASSGLADDGPARMGVWFDYNNDGLLDVLQHSSTGSVLKTRNQGSFTFRSGSNLCPGHGDYGQLSDINNDGTLDYICGRQGTFPQAIYDYSNGYFSEITRLVPEVSNVVDSITGDFNNDLKSDLILVRGALRGSGASKIDDYGIGGWLRGSSSVGFEFYAAGQVTFTVDHAPMGLYADPAIVVLDSAGTSNATPGGVNISYNRSTGMWRVTRGTPAEAFISVRAVNPVGDPKMINLASSELPTPVFHLANAAAGYTVVHGTGLGSAENCVSGVAADFDNDMDLDLYLACRQGTTNLANRYFDNQGDGTFVEVLSHGGQGPVGTGFEFGVAESVATADYDVDGFVDLAVTNGLLYYPVSKGGPDSLFRNKGNGNHWIEIDLYGISSNRDGIGAKVYASAGGVTQLREQNGGYHRWSQNSQRIHFGLASNVTVDITVEWPSGRTDTYRNIPADTLYEAVEGGAISPVTMGPAVTTEFANGDECGQPSYEKSYGPAVLLWKDCGTDDWHIRFESGLHDESPIVSAGTLSGDKGFGYANGVNLGGDDSLLRSPADLISFVISVQNKVAASRGINFNTSDQGSACLEFTRQDIIPIIVGSGHKRVRAPFDLISLGSCIVDTDGDGIPNTIDPDDDNDGVPDVNDAFPLDKTESMDSDNDGVGDNGDVFPNDPHETADSDSDGVGDNADAFPNDPNETTDSDDDGVGDNSDAFPNDPNETTDSDGDGVGDNSDIDIDNDGLTNAAEALTQGGDFQIFEVKGLFRVANLATADAIIAFGGYASTTTYHDVVNISDGLSNGRFDGSQRFTYADNFAVRVTGNIVIDTAGTYTFGTNSDDGVRLRVDGVTVILDDKLHPAEDRFGQYSLSAGTHKIDLVFFEQSGYASLELFVAPGEHTVFSSSFKLLSSRTLSSGLDRDGDGVNNKSDLDSDNDTIPDVVEAGLSDVDGNYIVDDLVNDQGSVSVAPDTDADGIPDYLDRESNNPANDGTDYDINKTAYASLDTNGDGMITNADNGGGIDADGDGIDDLVDPDPTQTGGKPVITDSDSDGVPDSEDAYPNDPDRTVPSASVSDVTVVENNGNAQVTVVLSTPARQAANVTLDTMDGSAIAGSDYVAVNQTLSYAVGESTQSVLIPLYDDTTEEPTENFSVQLGNPSNLDLGIANATVSIKDNDTSSGVSDACYEPSYDRSTEKGVFVWKLCDGSGEWRMRVTGGGDAGGVFYKGQVESVGGLNYTEYNIESNDVIINSNPDILVYLMKVWGSAEDGIDFVPAANACLTVSEPAVPIYLGKNRVEVQSSLNLTTLGSCSKPIPVECGEPVYDKSADPGLYLWKDCEAVSPNSTWSLRVVGGGLGWGSYTGTLTSSETVTATGEMLETNDTMDGNTNDNGLDFTLYVANAGVDGIDFNFPVTSQTCFNLTSLPGGAQLYLGKDKVQKTGAFNLEDLGICQ